MKLMDIDYFGITVETCSIPALDHSIPAVLTHFSTAQPRKPRSLLPCRAL